MKNRAADSIPVKRGNYYHPLLTVVFQFLAHFSICPTYHLVFPANIRNGETNFCKETWAGNYCARVTRHSKFIKVYSTFHKIKCCRLCVIKHFDETKFCCASISWKVISNHT